MSIVGVEHALVDRMVARGRFQQSNDLGHGVCSSCACPPSFLLFLSSFHLLFINSKIIERFLCSHRRICMFSFLCACLSSLWPHIGFVIRNSTRLRSYYSYARFTSFISLHSRSIFSWQMFVDRCLFALLIMFTFPHIFDSFLPIFTEGNAKREGCRGSEEWEGEIDE